MTAVDIENFKKNGIKEMIAAGFVIDIEATPVDEEVSENVQNNT